MHGGGQQQKRNTVPTRLRSDGEEFCPLLPKNDQSNKRHQKTVRVLRIRSPSASQLAESRPIGPDQRQRHCADDKTYLQGATIIDHGCHRVVLISSPSRRPIGFDELIWFRRNRVLPTLHENTSGRKTLCPVRLDAFTRGWIQEIRIFLDLTIV